MILNDKFQLQAEECEGVFNIGKLHFDLCNGFCTDFRPFLKRLKDKIPECGKYTSCTKATH